MAMDGRYAGNAGAFSGACLHGRASKNEAPALWPWMAGTPEMQEHFSARACMAEASKNGAPL